MLTGNQNETPRWRFSHRGELIRYPLLRQSKSKMIRVDPKLLEGLIEKEVPGKTIH